MSSDESGLGRWARRKAEARNRRGGAAPVLDKGPVEKQSPSEPKDALPAGSLPADSLPEGLDLPDIESLTAESDFSAFMKDGVPAALRRLALRKLWSSDPMFNIIDEMVEYGEDYTNAATIVEGMQSAWEPGRGYARDDEKATAAKSDETEMDEPDEAGAQTIGEAEAEESKEARDEHRDITEAESEDDPELG